MMVFVATEKRNVVGQKKTPSHAKDTRHRRDVKKRERERERESAALFDSEDTHPTHFLGEQKQTDDTMMPTHVSHPARRKTSFCASLADATRSFLATECQHGRRRQRSFSSSSSSFRMCVFLSLVIIKERSFMREKKATKKRICLFILL